LLPGGERAKTGGGASGTSAEGGAAKAEGRWRIFVHEMREGVRSIQANRY